MRSSHSFMALFRRTNTYDSGPAMEFLTDFTPRLAALAQVILIPMK